eukprot:3152478-Lingulodinium_polyedra.AAC.1
MRICLQRSGCSLSFVLSCLQAVHAGARRPREAACPIVRRPPCVCARQDREAGGHSVRAAGLSGFHA